MLLQDMMAPVYSNERLENREGQPREIRRYQSNDYRDDNDHNDFKSRHYGYKKKRQGFFNDFFDFD